MLGIIGRLYMFRAPWMALWPGVALGAVVYGINVFGDALRDLLDPRLRGGGGNFKLAGRDVRNTRTGTASGSQEEASAVVGGVVPTRESSDKG
jgi:hypothetical protein